jgi:hypothetical protein
MRRTSERPTATVPDCLAGKRAFVAFGCRAYGADSRTAAAETVGRLYRGLIFLMLAQAEPYPSKAVRVLVPNTAGSAADSIARLVSHRLADSWKQAVVVENRAGVAAGPAGAISCATWPRPCACVCCRMTRCCMNASWLCRKRAGPRLASVLAMVCNSPQAATSWSPTFPACRSWPQRNSIWTWRPIFRLRGLLMPTCMCTRMTPWAPTVRAPLIVRGGDHVDAVHILAMAGYVEAVIAKAIRTPTGWMDAANAPIVDAMTQALRGARPDAADGASRTVNR